MERKTPGARINHLTAVESTTFNLFDDSVY